MPLEKFRYGFKIYDDKEPVEYLIYHINHSETLNGFALKLSLKLKTAIRTSLTVGFCGFLCNKYLDEDLSDSFNKFQKILQEGFEEKGYLTLGNEYIDLPEGSLDMALNEKGIISFPTLDKLTLYRWIFDDNLENLEISILETERIYLLFDSKNNLIEIGESFYSISIEEKIPQEINSHLNLITTWIAPVSEEKELHQTFKEKRISGKWFDLNFRDLKLIKEKMKQYK